VDKNEVSVWNSFIKYCLFQYDTKYDEDDVQNCWVYLLEHSASFHTNGKSILRDYIRHYCIRKGQRKDPFNYTDMDQFYSEEDEPITINLSVLPEDEKQVIELFYYEGMSTSQIADKMGISEDQVYRRKKTALARLSGSSCIE
jgi:RNA polymerase sigma factor (sigma-70 family)